MDSPTANAAEPSDNVHATHDYPSGGDQSQPSTPAGLTSSSSDTLNLINLHVDSDLGDNDSAIGDPSIHSSTTSARDSVFAFVEENGRTYHRFRAGQYDLPNDEREQDRLDLQHQLFLLTLSGELHLAPIKDLPGGLHNVLDFGTGTGIWAIEFANLFPSANVLGTDLSPIQPQFVPPNCRFEVDDAEDSWEFSQKFDYIHGRAMATCFKSHFKVIRSAFGAVRPGGYLELQDFMVPFVSIDDSIKGTSLERWGDLILKGSRALGKDWTRAPKYKAYMKEAGFEDVVEHRYQWPVGTWARGQRMKLLGMWCREDYLSALQAATLAVLTRGLGMSVEDIEPLLVGVRDDIKSNRVHIYVPIYVVYGRKPALPV